MNAADKTEFFFDNNGNPQKQYLLYVKKCDGYFK